MFHSEELLRAFNPESLSDYRRERRSHTHCPRHRGVNSLVSDAGNKPSSNKTKPKPPVFDSFPASSCSALLLRPSVAFTDADFPENVVRFLLRHLSLANLAFYPFPA